MAALEFAYQKKRYFWKKINKSLLELISTIGGFIPVLNIVFNIILKTFVNSLDHLRLLNLIKKRKISKIIMIIFQKIFGMNQKTI